MKLLVLDPLTLLGRELLAFSDRLAHRAPELEFRHTSIDDEHQIADLEVGPALVPPLDGPDELEGFDVIIVASDAQGSRHDHLLDFLKHHPEAGVLDLSRLEFLHEITDPLDGRTSTESRQVRVAHPMLVATARVVEVMSAFGLVGGSLAVVDPVSTGGREAIDLLVKQAIQRLRGEQVSELIFDHVRAFNVVAIDSFALQEEAARVLPDVPFAVTHCLSGTFHGHLGHLSLSFDQPAAPEMVREALAETEDLEAADFPAALNAVPDTDRVLVTPAALSADGRQVALTLMTDGLRIGGALTALAILDTVF
jgi:hypothetical protein